jgi:hypothetical protein
MTDYFDACADGMQSLGGRRTDFGSIGRPVALPSEARLIERSDFAGNSARTQRRWVTWAMALVSAVLGAATPAFLSA